MRTFHRRLLISAAILGSGVTAANAAFTMTATRSDAGARDVITLTVVDTTLAATGGVLQALDLTGTVVPKVGDLSARAYFRVVDTNTNTVPDTVDVPNVVNDPGFSFVRIGSAANTTLIVDGSATIPSGGFQEPNSWLNGVNGFQIVELASVFPPTIEPGLVIARLVVDDGAGLTLQGTFAGSTGPAGIVPLVVAPLPEPSVLATVSVVITSLFTRRRAEQ